MKLYSPQIMVFVRNIDLLFFLIIFQNCNPTYKVFKTETFSKEKNVNCIIEIPAGTSKKIELYKNSKKFAVDVHNGKERIIEYLPYPGNYGFIASTYSNPDEGGDGDPLDVLVLCESLKTGTILETKPIAMLRLLDNGEEDFKVICIPSDRKLQTVSAETFTEFSEKYLSAIEIIEMWFINYNPSDRVKIIGWSDEKEALLEIQKLSIPLKN